MIVVTGGAGFIGSNFVRAWLAAQDEAVLNIDKLTYAGNRDNLASLEGDSRHVFVQADIGDRAILQTLLQKYAPRAIFNFAAETHVDRSIQDSSDFLASNVVGTHALLENARDYWLKLPDPERRAFRIIHVSTDEVYGDLDTGAAAASEEHAYRPNSPYAASKAASDHLARAWYRTYGLPIITTNCSNNYGPYQFPEKLIPLIITNALAEKQLPIYGDGEQVRDWLFVTDHCNALRLILEKGRPGETYNIGSGSERSNLSVVSQICSLLNEMRPRTDGVSYERQIAFITDRPGHDRRYALNADKIERELGWRPKEGFEAGLAKTVSWYLENQTWMSSVTTSAKKSWLTKQYGAD